MLNFVFFSFFRLHDRNTLYFMFFLFIVFVFVIYFTYHEFCSSFFKSKRKKSLKSLDIEKIQSELDLSSLQEQKTRFRKKEKLPSLEDYTEIKKTKSKPKPKVEKKDSVCVQF